MRLVAEDLVDHFEQRLEAMDGKAMIVCMSRRICVDLYNADREAAAGLAQRRRRCQGVLKIVMTGSAADGPDWQQHIRDKRRREELGKRFKKAERPVQGRDRARHVAHRLRCAAACIPCTWTSRCAGTG